MPDALPVVLINGQSYFMDARRKEFRSVAVPTDVLTFEQIDNDPQLDGEEIVIVDVSGQHALHTDGEEYEWSPL